MGRGVSSSSFAGPARLAAALSLAAGLGLAIRASGVERPEAERAAGTYRMVATVRLSPGALPVRELEARGDARLEPGQPAGAIRARLAARGQRCVLDARVAAGGALSFPAGQVCRVTLADEEARGSIEARLEAGSGRVEGGTLSLDLVFALDGAVRLRPASLELLGGALGSAGGLLPEVPVTGEARARAEGRRDESRAAER